MDYTKYITVIEGFPKPGISFKDISPLLKNGEAYHSACDDMAKLAAEFKPTIIIGPEARGFIFGCPIAYSLDIGFVMSRKIGKLPGETLQVNYGLEYGHDTIAIPAHSIQKGDRVVIVDDLLATGGTLRAIIKLVRMAGAEVVGTVTFIELKDLQGEKVLEEEGVPFRTLLRL